MVYAVTSETTVNKNIAMKSAHICNLMCVTISISTKPAKTKPCPFVKGGIWPALVHR